MAKNYEILTEIDDEKIIVQGSKHGGREKLTARETRILYLLIPM